MAVNLEIDVAFFAKKIGASLVCLLFPRFLSCDDLKLAIRVVLSIPKPL